MILEELGNFYGCYYYDKYDGNNYFHKLKTIIVHAQTNHVMGAVCIDFKRVPKNFVHINPAGSVLQKMQTRLLVNFLRNYNNNLKVCNNKRCIVKANDNKDNNKKLKAQIFTKIKKLCIYYCCTFIDTVIYC